MNRNMLLAMAALSVAGVGMGGSASAQAARDPSPKQTDDQMARAFAKAEEKRARKAAKRRAVLEQEDTNT